MAHLRGSCHNCGEATVGPIMTAGMTKFHPECFRCCHCQQCIGDDEQYTLVGLSTLYCIACWTKEPQHDLERQHVIKLVTLPPLVQDGTQYKLMCDWNDGYKSDALWVSRVLAVGKCGSECHLNVGDRVLDVNGTHVHNCVKSDVEDLLNQRTSVVQVTVEQSPTSEVSVRKLEETKAFGSLSSLELRSTDSWGGFGDMDKSKERLNRRRDDHRSRQPRRSIKGCEQRAASLSRLSDCSPSPPGYIRTGLARTLSFREQARSQYTFRACDLVKGEMVGRGFYGEVYKVTHSEIKEDMVLKQLHHVNKESEQQFLKEVALLRRLEHPNVLRFIGVLYKEKKLHLIAEFAPGGTLRELINKSDLYLSWALRSKLARDISRGMAYAHSMGVMHRDLSSHNILVREDMTVVVADFGLARITSEMYQTDRSRPNRLGRKIDRRKRYTVVGNYYWMAPEMMNGNEYDEKVDIFSFGIVLCELIGRIPADPDILPRSGDFSLNQQTFLEKYCTDCPEPLYRIAFMCCDLNPDKRPCFEVLANWLESVTSSLNRGLPFPNTLLDEISRFACKSPISNDNISSEISSGVDIDIKNENSSNLPLSNTTFVENTLSSTCSSMSVFTKPGRLHSICEVDHSSNIDSKSNSTLSTTEMGEAINCNSQQIGA